MGLFTIKPVPARWDPRWLMELLISLRGAFQLSESNFPNRLNGDTLVQEKTLGPDRLRSELLVGVLIAQASTFTTTSTSLVTIGPLLLLDPMVWPYNETHFQFEITAGPIASGASAVVELWDSTGPVASHTLNVVGQARYRTVFTRLPTGYLVVKLNTTNASAAAGILGASVVFTP